ncbi:dUTPase [Listeria costaricensis]|uniref:dUTPase n=1 Tax=Listeria costaricensis TaxID=2026604 RepID=UPI000C0856ED|nr:dUTPase [Listeria costaricensis]
MKQRGFEIVTPSQRKFPEETVQLPVRGDKGSAGYDFFSNETAILAPGEQHVFWTDIKAYMLEDEVLSIFVRSSIGIKRGLILSNSTGIIDSSYYSNPGNDGNIGIAMKNITAAPVEIGAGERIAQGIFSKYLVADEDCVQNEARIGGVGSTGK